MIHRDALWILELRKAKVSKMTMKKSKTLQHIAAALAVLLALCLVFVMPVGAVDATKESKIGDVEYATLAGAVEVAKEGDTITLLKDVDLGSNFISITKSLILDLNGHEISSSKDTIAVTGEGVILTIGDSSDDESGLITTSGNGYVAVWTYKGATVILNKGTIQSTFNGNGPNGFAVQVGKSNKPDKGIVGNPGHFTMNGGKLISYKTGLVQVNGTATISGGSISADGKAISGNGNNDDTTITINGGSLTGGVTGIYHPQNGLLIINGGTITGNVAVYFKSGSLEVSSITGGHLIGNGEKKSYMYYGNGFIPTGDALVIENVGVGGYQGISSISITGGTFTSTNAEAVASYVPKDNDKYQVDSSGETNELSNHQNYNELIGASRMTEFITGGTYSSDVSEYVAEGYYAQPNADGTYTVKNTCDVTFESNGGSAVTAEQVPYTSPVTEPTYPTKEGYTFDGWYTDADCTDAYDFTKAVTSDITLYAKWTAKQYEISVNGGVATPSQAIINTEIELTPTEKEGYLFKEWNVASGDIKIENDKFTMPASDVEIFAVYDKVLTKEEVITPEISVDIVVEGGTTTIKTDTTTETETTIGLKGDDENTVVITDANTGVQINVQFTEKPETSTSGDYTGTVESVSINYPEAPAEVVEGTGEVKQTVLFDLNNAAIPDDIDDKLPSIDSKKNPKVVETVTKQEQRANVLAMITATHEDLSRINAHIATVTITFKVHADLIANTELLKAYHVKGDAVDDLGKPAISEKDSEGFYTITITSDKKFSSYVLAEAQEVKNDNVGGGSAVDTGSGNYQYYPRSVPTDGIVDFGTSKVVTGMELPAGSSGKVTLNIKPTFAMPENGYYAFEIDAPGYNTDAKINGGLSFQIPVADLEAEGFTANDIVLFHGTVAEDGKITWEALPTNLVKVENGIAYYKAAIAGCSPFYIGFVEDGSIVNTEVVDPVTPETPETPVTPDEPEVLPPVDEPETPEQPTESPAPILAVLAGLGAAAVLRRK